MADGDSGGTTFAQLSRGVARRHQNAIAVIATIGGFLFGYDTGVISGALLYITKDLHLDSAQQSIVVSCLLIGAAFGATFGGRLTDSIGRRRTIHLAAVLFIIGTLGSAVSTDMYMLIAVRVVLGLAVGGVSSVVPLYIGEIAPVKRRGRLVDQNEVMIVTGQLVASIVNAIIANLISNDTIWRLMLGIALIPAVALFVLVFRIPESPRWLINHDQIDTATRVLHEIRTPDDADEEISNLKEAHEERKQQPDVRSIQYLAARWVRVLVLMGIALNLIQQLAGVNAVVYYAPTVLSGAGLGQNTSVTANIGVGVVGLLGTFLGLYQVGRINRRPMLMAGQIGVIACHTILALLFVFSASVFGILGVMLVFVFFQQAFVSTVTWLMMSELFPMRVRGFAMGIGVFFQWATNFAVSTAFPNVVSAFGGAFGFGGFAVLSLGGLMLTIFVLPETRNVRLEDLERGFKKRYGR
jgi:major inositol transporter-like SP family MFS transporter